MAYSQYGDIIAQYTSFDAMFSALYGTPRFVRHKNSTFSDLFSSICSEKNGVEEGCAVFSVNFYGGKDRTISKYEYQV